MNTLKTFLLLFAMSGMTYLQGQNLESFEEKYPSGQLKIKGSTQGDNKIGNWTYYHEDGKMKRQENYDEKGVPSGPWLWYDAEGNFEKKVDMTGNSDGYTNIQMGKMKISINEKDNEASVDLEIDSDSIKKDEGRDNTYLLIDIGVSGAFFNSSIDIIPNNGDELYSFNIAKSGSFSFYRMYSIPNKKILNLDLGIGMEFTHYRFENNTLLRDSIGVTLASRDTTRSYEKNNLKTTYIKAPIFVTFTSRNEDIKFSVGGILGINTLTKLKRLYGSTEDDGFVKEIIATDYNVSPFTLSAGFRAYYKWFGIYGTYNLTRLFEKPSSAPIMNPFSVGASFNF